MANLSKYCQKGDFLTANSSLTHVGLLMKDSILSHWFSTAAHVSVVGTIVNYIRALKENPFKQDKFNLYFIDRFLTTIHGPPLAEKVNGMNDNAEKWMEVFRDCLQQVDTHEDHKATVLWLFTLGECSGTLTGDALRSLTKAYRTLRPSENAKKQRDQSLCQFRTVLCDYDWELSKDFSKKLNTSGEFGHCCWDSLHWSIRVLKKRLHKVFLRQQTGAPLWYH